MASVTAAKRNEQQISAAQDKIERIAFAANTAMGYSPANFAAVSYILTGRNASLPNFDIAASTVAFAVQTQLGCLPALLLPPMAGEAAGRAQLAEEKSLAA
jgi:hypothetical protein